MKNMDKSEIEKLHGYLLKSWNNRDAKGMAELFADDGTSIGFDGSQYNGKAEIESEIGKVFSDHHTAAFVWKVTEVRFLSSEVALLRAVAGMVLPGQKFVMPATNAIQSVVTVKQTALWKIALFQNTPAQFHGRPELSEQLTKELNALTAK